jgi:hypothetical protein
MRGGGGGDGDVGGAEAVEEEEAVKHAWASLSVVFPNVAKVVSSKTKTYK